MRYNPPEKPLTDAEHDALFEEEENLDCEYCAGTGMGIADGQNCTFCKGKGYFERAKKGID